MRALAVLAVLVGVAACGGSSGGGSTTGPTSGGTSGASSASTSGSTTTTRATSTSGATSSPTPASSSTGATARATTSTSSGASSTGGSACGACPATYTCATANGLPVCRAPSGIPLFTHVLVIVEENMSLATVQAGTMIPYLSSLGASAATSTSYSGVAHPSLPNYLALTSGEDVSGVGCDCQPTGGSCSVASCNALLGSCGCPQTTRCLADDLTQANLTWRSYAESMGTPCNVTAAGSYAPKHVPFLYYPQIQTNAAVCNAGVVDFSSFTADLAAGTLPTFSFLSPNLTDDGHDPAFPLNGNQNLVNIDTWLGTQVPPILASAAYKNGGLVVIVWDEDDDSIGDNPIPIFVLSPYARAGHVSTVAADHYSLLATFEDGLALPRLGKAATATPLVDFFPAN